MARSGCFYPPIVPENKQNSPRMPRILVRQKLGDVTNQRWHAPHKPHKPRKHFQRMKPIPNERVNRLPALRNLLGPVPNSPQAIVATKMKYFSPRTTQCRKLVQDLDTFSPRMKMRDNLKRLAEKRERLKREGASRAAQIAAAAAAAAHAWSCSAQKAVAERRAASAAAAAARAALTAAGAQQLGYAQAVSAVQAAEAERDRDRAQRAAAAAAQAAASAAACARRLEATVLAGVDGWLGDMELKRLLRVLQEMVVTRLGDSTPCVAVDLVQNRVDINEAMNFKGGTAEVLPEDLRVMDQIVQAVLVVYECVDAVNDQLEERGKARTFTMPHLRVEGHVHKSKRSTKASTLATSQARADAVVERIVTAGVPRRYLHPQGFGASAPHPSGLPEDNRRVEIKVMDDAELAAFIRWKFEAYDVDDSGFLDRAQVTNMAVDMGKTLKQIERDFSDMDKDGTGKIWLDELHAWFLAT